MKNCFEFYIESVPLESNQLWKHLACEQERGRKGGKEKGACRNGQGF